MYILINPNDIPDTEIYSKKQGILDKLSVNRRTLNRAIENKALIKGYYVLDKNVNTGRYKGRDFNTISIGY